MVLNIFSLSRLSSKAFGGLSLMSGRKHPPVQLRRKAASRRFTDGIRRKVFKFMQKAASGRVAVNVCLARLAPRQCRCRKNRSRLKITFYRQHCTVIIKQVSNY